MWESGRFTIFHALHRREFPYSVVRELGSSSQTIGKRGSNLMVAAVLRSRLAVTCC